MTTMQTRNRMTLTIRQATPEDAELIHTMTQAAYAEYANSDAPSTVAQERADDLRAALDAGETQAMIVEGGGLPLGSVRYRVEEDALYFFRLGVLPEARGRGAARRMVAEIEDIARRKGLPKLRCRVRMNVARNVSLYASQGFVIGDVEAVRRGTTDVPTGTMEKILQ
jgi:ribosomal protein S18 acetylase RimI-like enzyme